MNIKYRVKFTITNLDTQELRDFKLNLVGTNNVLEFESETSPRLPNKSDKIKIAGRTFEIESSDSEYTNEDGQFYNIFNFYLLDIEKKNQKEAEELMKAFQSQSKGRVDRAKKTKSIEDWLNDSLFDTL